MMSVFQSRDFGSRMHLTVQDLKQINENGHGWNSHNTWMIPVVMINRKRMP